MLKKSVSGVENCEGGQNSIVQKKRNNKNNKKKLTSAESVDNDETKDYKEIKYPDPPLQVLCSDSDGICYLWWEYANNTDNKVISWEIIRYRNDQGAWNSKGSYILLDKSPRKYVISDLERNHQYRFSVGGTNQYGKGKHSILSNAVLIEAALPNGWFRSVSGNQFFYFNINLQQVSKERPENNKTFISNETIYKSFSSRELDFIRSIFDEELMHFHKVTSARLRIMLLECGEDFACRSIALAMREIGDGAEGGEGVAHWETFLEIMYTFKLLAIKTSGVVAQARKQISLLWDLLGFGGGDRKDVADLQLQPSTLLKRFGDEWEKRYSSYVDRSFYLHKPTRKKYWFTPKEVRLFIPASEMDIFGLLDTVLDPVEMEIVKNTFLHLDLGCTGEVDETELFRYVYIASRQWGGPQCRLELASPTLSASLATTRPMFFKALTNGRGVMRYLDFLKFLLSLAQLNCTSTTKVIASSNKRPFTSIYSDISVFRPTRSSLSQTLELYLLAVRDNKYQDFSSVGNKNLNRKINVAPSSSNQFYGDDDEKRDFDNDNDDGSTRSVVKKLATNENCSINGVISNKFPHGKFCMCGCRNCVYKADEAL